MNLHVKELPMAHGGGEFYYGIEVPNREELQRMLTEVSSDPAVTFGHRLPGRRAVEAR